MSISPTISPPAALLPGQDRRSYLGQAAGPVALLILVVLAPLFWRIFYHEQPRDFVQEWASARNFFTGHPIYENQQITLREYLGLTVAPGGFVLEYNAHPPTSVLLVLPFGLLPYGTALALWNAFSFLALIAVLITLGKQGGRTWTLTGICWMWAAIVAAGLFSPLREQFLQGQWNLVLLLLITPAFFADNADRPALAGVLLGLAVTIKLFPGFLLFYYLVRLRWTILLAATATIGGMTLLTVSVLGLNAYQDYAFQVLPTLQMFRSSWPGLSLNNFWCKLFDPVPTAGPAFPLWYSPPLARALTMTSCLLVVSTLGWMIYRAKTRAQRDRSFALTMVAMLLVSPIAWDHYLVLLILPAVLFWNTLASSSRPFFVCIAVLLLLHRYFYWTPLVCDPREDWTRLTAQTWQSLTGLSVHFYALAAWFILGLRAPIQEQKDCA